MHTLFDILLLIAILITLPLYFKEKYKKKDTSPNSLFLNAIKSRVHTQFSVAVYSPIPLEYLKRFMEEMNALSLHLKYKSTDIWLEALLDNARLFLSVHKIEGDPYDALSQFISRKM